MAKYTEGCLVTNISGKVGKVVHCHNRWGGYVRIIGERTKPLSPAQIKKNEMFALIAPVWASLEDKEREIWAMQGSDRSIASMLRNKNIKTGWILFFSVNLIMNEIHEPYKRLVNSYKNPQTFSNLSISIEEIRRKKQLILHTSPAINDDTKLMIYGSSPVSPGRMRFTDNMYKLITVVGAKPKKDKTEGINLTDEYVRVYGRLPKNNEKASFKVKPVNRHCAVSTYPKTITFTYRNKEERTKS